MILGSMEHITISLFKKIKIGKWKGGPEHRKLERKPGKGIEIQFKS